MLRKVLVVLCMLALLSFSFTLLKKTENKKVAVEDTQEIVYEEEKLPDTTYTFNVEKLPETCEEADEVFCAVEKAVKCTIKTDLPFCAALDLPRFIFMTDPSIERPTEISYKFINKKVLPNNTIEIHTDSACNGRWFGLCQGTIIYVLKPADSTVKEWHVKDIYAIEN